ncbi:MAG: DinB family protein [Gemmatimonadales bacterium]
MNFDLAEATALLERTPTVLRGLLDGLPDGWIVTNEGADSWSPFNVVGHLIDGEETDWIPRARTILAREGDRRFVPFDRFRHLEVNRGRTLRELLDRFAVLREANLAQLRAWRLGPVELALTGEHPAFGAVTLAQLLATWAAHDLNHLGQIARVMAKRYADDVGPWRAYLPILHPRTPAP